MTIDRNKHFAQQTIDDLKANGFETPILKICPSVPKGSSLLKLRRSCMTNHFNVVQWFAQTFDTKTHHLMVCEDDCEFVEKNVSKLVHKQLAILDKNYKWSLYMLGHVACGPMFETKFHRLSRTTCPILAHCYVLNGNKLNGYLKWIGHNLWQSPFMTEGWLFVPFWQKFAIFPSIASQNRQLKFFTRFRCLRNISIIKYMRTFEHAMHHAPLILLFVFILIMLIKFFENSY